VVSWPPTPGHTLHLGWNYWWQAHLLDCLVDAGRREPTDRRRRTINQFMHGVRLRNLLRWTNGYYDDMAWMGIALLRADRLTGITRPTAVRTITRRLREGWSPDAGGGLWWRIADNFKNTPANAPAAILLTRLGDPADLALARALVDWLEEHLVDPDTGLVWDGLRVGPDGTITEVEKVVYTYCQGVFLGACVELAKATGETIWRARAVRTVDAVAEHLRSPRGVPHGPGGGDGGLFTGILVRYLAEAALELPELDTHPTTTTAATKAERMVLDTATAAWRTRSTDAGGPLFGPDWTRPTTTPSGGHRRSPRLPEHDLSVQLSAWMTLEAAALLERTPHSVTS
jgi:predicted alpha-1,6-mannanase (GH76 family)